MSEAPFFGPIQEQDEQRNPAEPMLAMTFESGDAASLSDTAGETSSNDEALVDRLVRRQHAVIEDLDALDERILTLLATWQRERPAA